MFITLLYCKMQMPGTFMGVLENLCCQVGFTCNLADAEVIEEEKKLHALLRNLIWQNS